LVSSHTVDEPFQHPRFSLLVFAPHRRNFHAAKKQSKPLTFSTALMKLPISASPTAGQTDIINQNSAIGPSVIASMPMEELSKERRESRETVALSNVRVKIKVPIHVLGLRAVGHRARGEQRQKRCRETAAQVVRLI